MTKPQPRFYPIIKAPFILEFIESMLEDFKLHLESMKKLKGKTYTYVLDTKLINRSIKLHTAQKSDLSLFLQQCSIWRKSSLTELQLHQVQEIENKAHTLIQINNEILTIVNSLKDNNIDKVLEKDDTELALDTLTGKMPVPKL